MSWPIVPFKQAIRDVSGGNKKLKASEYLESGQFSVIDQGAKATAGYSNRAEFLVKTKPPLIVFGDHTKIIKYVDKPFIMGADGTKILSPTKGFNAKYLYHYLRSIELPDAGYSRHFKFLKELEIPSPPPEDQERIAALLDKADALRRQRQESLELTDKLLQSIFIDMFGDPIANSMDWPILPLGHFGVVTTGNTPPRSNKRNYAQEGIEWIKTDNIIENRVIVSQATERLSDLGFKAARVAAADSLLVACIAGSEKSIGRASLTDRKVAFNQQINAITPHSDTSPLFLYFLIKTGRRQIQEAASKGMKKMINKSTFEALKFIAPPYKLQLRFDRVAKTVIAQSEATYAQQKQIGLLFHSLQKRAFSGNLDLSRVWMENDVEELEQAVAGFSHLVNVTMPKTLGDPPLHKAFQPSTEIYREIKRLDEDLKNGDPIPWSPDYLRYRIIPSLKDPFNFDDLMTKAQKVFKETSYDEIHDVVFELLGDNGEQPALRQRFDHAVDEDTSGITGSQRMVFDFVS